MVDSARGAGALETAELVRYTLVFTPVTFVPRAASHALPPPHLHPAPATHGLVSLAVLLCVQCKTPINLMQPVPFSAATATAHPFLSVMEAGCVQGSSRRKFSRWMGKGLIQASPLPLCTHWGGGGVGDGHVPRPLPPPHQGCSHQLFQTTDEANVQICSVLSPAPFL